MPTENNYVGNGEVRLAVYNIQVPCIEISIITIHYHLIPKYLSQHIRLHGQGDATLAWTALHADARSGDQHHRVELPDTNHWTDVFSGRSLQVWRQALFTVLFEFKIIQV